jgi:hypothetical protein
MDDTNKTQGAGQEAGSEEKKEAGPVDKKPGPRPRPTLAGPPRGMSSSVNRTAKFGPEGPINSPSPRQRLCALLGLKGPTDTQLFGDAAAEIEKLQAELAGRK